MVATSPECAKRVRRFARRLRNGMSTKYSSDISRVSAPRGFAKIMSWDAIYRLVKQIPRGRVTTYGEIARALKMRGGARVVGYAMAGRRPAAEFPGIAW